MFLLMPILLPMIMVFTSFAGMASEDIAPEELTMVMYGILSLFSVISIFMLISGLLKPFITGYIQLNPATI